MKLIELADPNHPLLKRFLEAPELPSSLMVVTWLKWPHGMAATPCRRGWAPITTISGSLSVPIISKKTRWLRIPDSLAPSMSSRIITSPTRDGEELALKYKLPRLSAI